MLAHAHTQKTTISRDQRRTNSQLNYTTRPTVFAPSAAFVVALVTVRIIIIIMGREDRRRRRRRLYVTMSAITLQS